MSITYAHINKSLVRFHYTEWSYNEHWGGDSLGTLLRQPNPLLNTEAVAIAEADPSCDFDFSLYVDQLTSPAYPPSEETGVYLYWGFADGSRGVYSETLQEMKSAELDELAEALQRTNYYSLETKWLARLQPSASKFETTVARGECFFRARIGYRDEAFRTDTDSELDEPPSHVIFPYVGDQIAAPPQSLAKGGRLNRANITFLYLASTLDTALAEVRPHPGHVVSIGQFRTDRPLRIANLAGVELLPFATSEAQLQTFVLLRNIEHAFAMPVLPEDGAGYMLTQFLADTLRRLSFEGVTFRSSVTSGTNLVVFDPSTMSYVAGSADVRQVKSLVYAVETPAFEAKRSRAPGVQYWPIRNKR